MPPPPTETGNYSRTVHIYDKETGKIVAEVDVSDPFLPDEEIVRRFVILTGYVPDDIRPVGTLTGPVRRGIRFGLVGIQHDEEDYSDPTISFSEPRLPDFLVDPDLVAAQMADYAEQQRQRNKKDPIKKGGSPKGQPIDNPCFFQHQLNSNAGVSNHHANQSDVDLWRGIADGTDTRFWVSKDSKGNPRMPRQQDPMFQEFLDAYNQWMSGVEGLKLLKELLDSGGTNAFYQKLKDAIRQIELGASALDVAAELSEDFPPLSAVIKLLAIGQGMNALTAEGILRTLEETLSTPDLLYDFFESLFQIEYIDMMQALATYIDKAGKAFGVGPCAIDKQILKELNGKRGDYLRNLKDLLGNDSTLNNVLDYMFGDVLRRFDIKRGKGD